MTRLGICARDVGSADGQAAFRLLYALALARVIPVIGAGGLID